MSHSPLYIMFSSFNFLEFNEACFGPRDVSSSPGIDPPVAFIGVHYHGFHDHINIIFTSMWYHVLLPIFAFFLFIFIQTVHTKVPKFPANKATASFLLLHLCFPFALILPCPHSSHRATNRIGLASKAVGTRPRVARLYPLAINSASISLTVSVF